MTKIVIPPKDAKRPYTQRQLLDAIKAIMCKGQCVVVPNTPQKPAAERGKQG